MSKELLITDFSIAQPNDKVIKCDGTAFTPTSTKREGCWRLIDYSTEQYSGRFLQSSDPSASTLTINLDLKGIHAISIGIAATGVKTSETAIEVRLSGESNWQLIRTYEWNYIIEEPWTIADLTGKNLEVRYPDKDYANGNKPTIARLFSIRIVAVDQEDIKLIQNKQKRKVMFVCDGWDIYKYSSEPGLDILKNYFKPYHGSEWNVCCFGSGGSDVVLYNTKIGTIMGEGAWDFEPGFNKHCEKIKEMINSGVDPLKSAIDQAHRQDIPIIIYMRNQLWTCEPPYDQIIRSKFFTQHPEYSCVEADGTLLQSKLSIGFKEVRNQMNAILSESIERGADGVALCFVRGFPLVRYEKPVLDMYSEIFGGDAREVKPDDERIRKVWGMFATQWIREIREILDKAGSSFSYQRRKLMIFGGHDLEWNLQYGIDIGSWAKENLIDIVVPYPRGSELNHEKLQAGIKEYAEKLKGTDVEILPSLGSFADHKISLLEYRKRAHELYKGGATGLSRWDTDHWMTNLDWDEPAVQKLWVEKYMPLENNKIISTAGLERIIFTPRIGV